MRNKKNKTSTEVKKIKPDLYLINEIQPQGGISFLGEEIVKTGDGFEACLEVYEYPKSVNRHWLTTLLNIAGVICVVDINTNDQKTAVDNLKRSISEIQAEKNMAKKTTDAMDASAEEEKVQRLYWEVSQMGELVKSIRVRLYISGPTPEEVRQNVSRVRGFLESSGYKSAIYLNETENQWKAFYYSTSQQDDAFEYKRAGQSLVSNSLAGGYPFHFTSLLDKQGYYYGTTVTSGGGGGKVLLDLFLKSKIRTSYNAIVSGRLGAGKSTLLKKILLDRAIRGDNAIIFDASGEFETLVNTLGGKCIALDGTNGIINPFHIMRADESENNNLSIHRSKLKTWYQFLNQSATHIELLFFEELCSDFYVEMKIIPANTNDLSKYQITGLNATDYPTLSDLISFVETRIKNTSSDDTDTLKKLKDILLVLKNARNGYGHMFDGHTSIENLEDTSIVCFNIKSLTSMSSNIFDAQLFQGLSLAWDRCVSVGTKMKNAFENNEISWEDITRSMLIIDESHRTINTSKPHALDQALLYARESRKYFSGIVLASQSIRDYVPQSSAGGKVDEGSIEKLKTLFELSTYKFVMSQDSNTLDIIRDIFQGQLTESQVQSIPELAQGETVLSILNHKALTFQVEVDDEELALFKGGA